MSKRIISLVLCLVLCFSCTLAFVSCGGDDTNNAASTDTLVIMTENLDGVFNPFFSTSANDGTIVAMTQIAMLTSKYVNGAAEVAFGDNEAVVTKDFEYKTNADGDTVYTFVLKNGIKFADGEPLTMEDVLFNLYVYLDPVYTGSSTIYSTDIKGLADYRAQKYLGDDNTDDSTSDMAASRAQDRINTLAQLFMTAGKSETMSGESYNISIEDMKAAIANASIDLGYKNSISTPAEQDAGKVDYNKQLLADYELTLEKFKTELERDYASAKDSYTDEPYKSVPEFQDEVFCFMFAENYVEVEYNKIPGTNKDDKNSIKKVTPLYSKDVVKDKNSAINFVYNDKVTSELHVILNYWATATELRTEYSAKAMEVILAENIKDGELTIKNISGIVSLGHSTETPSVTVNGNTYAVAQDHNADGTPKNADTYDVLQITINDVDPKAHWNFAFTVAPQHYYGKGANTPVDIENDKFGVDYGSFEFMKNVVQSTRNIKLPMGAGPYKVTNRANDDAPAEGEFYTNGIVYFKANNNFETVGSGLSNAKIGKVRYQVVSANNAITALEEGSVHYITPQLTDDNYDRLNAMEDQGIKSMFSEQLGYGYIGINASKVQDLNIRKAIMCAMNTKQALEFYRPGTASQIYWPMSKVSWAYPKDSAMDNYHEYPQMNGSWDENLAKTNVQKYMDLAGVSAGDSKLKITFTIAGSNLQEHPVYKTFRDAAKLLNDMGWNVTVTPDTQALTKINSGSLEVWAAAWGSTIDPDMYQVYHKNSTAGSTNAWGYPYIKTSGTAEEKDILTELSDLIDAARETTVQSERAALYKQAMSKVLDLAIELPVYQRSQLYAYNSNVLDPDTLPSEINPYTSPIDRIWELDFKK